MMPSTVLTAFGCLESVLLEYAYGRAEKVQKVGRILLTEPALVFLDDASSALDDKTEAELYGLLQKAPWQLTIVSATYKSTLPKFHEQVVDICDFAPGKN